MAKNTKRAAAPKATPDHRSRATPDHRTGNRASAAFQLVRQFVVRALATAGTPTTEIAKSLGLSRSFTIKQAHIVLKPRTAAERRILKVATEHEAKLKRMGISGLLGGEDITTVLAGGERPKLGPLADRRAKAEKLAARKAPAKRKVKTNSVVEAVKALPKAKKTAPPKAKPSKTPAAKVAATPASIASAQAAQAKRVRKSRPKASDLKAPLPAERLVDTSVTGVTSEPAQATIDDLLADTNGESMGEAPPADAPI